ncbi:hypothetical protein VYU27_010801, partial [Nannochloropsis oceanica]
MSVDDFFSYWTSPVDRFHRTLALTLSIPPPRLPLPSFLPPLKRRAKEGGREGGREEGREGGEEQEGGEKDKEAKAAEVAEGGKEGRGEDGVTRKRGKKIKEDKRKENEGEADVPLKDQ